MNELLQKVIENEVAKRWRSEYEDGIDSLLASEAWTCDDWLDHLFETGVYLPGVEVGEDKALIGEIQAAKMAAEMYSTRLQSFRDEYNSLMRKYFQ